ncbi:hypothetical protein T492DRAFT_866436 [Pavlovales sp. CCMP2436]|nr:hypothetical protein T492DRAFT_866436 [Pavlovales sp. CCMP2436]|mmetsp:Transcript_5622/g.14673  ORF Transcript_5622/g.14673 Transcript_5622/m.14673 type:complete len:167 (-) Transcript_5622:195-695(-)
MAPRSALVVAPLAVLAVAVSLLVGRRLLRVLASRRRPRGILVRSRRASRRTEAHAQWDEPTLEEHQKERGVVYGTMKIDHPDTPFLYYDKEADEPFEYVKGDTPKTVDVHELQQKLGVLHLAHVMGEEVTPHGAAISKAVDEHEKRLSAFEAKRRAHYKLERTGGD